MTDSFCYGSFKPIRFSMFIQGALDGKIEREHWMAFFIQTLQQCLFNAQANIK